MSKFPKRGEYGFWYNEEPITDKHEALDLLAKESPTYEPNHLNKNTRLGVWEIIVPWYSHGDSGGDQNGYHYFQINAALAEKLATGDLMKPREIQLEHGPYRPYGEFVLSEIGKSCIRRYRDEQEKEARGMLVLGIHTDLTGKIERRGSGREQWCYGDLYFDFFTPNGICRVYPESKKLVYPYDG